MTDRFNALIVTLDQNIREDDAESLMEAIRHLRGVGDVMGHVATSTDAIAEGRARRELIDRLFEVLEPPHDPR